MRTEFVTGSYFSTLGIGAFAGRVFSTNDDQPGASPVVVVSYHAWQLSYGTDPAILGSTLMVKGFPFTVIGIAPPGFFGETLEDDPPDLWIPLEQEPAIDGAGALLQQPMGAWLRVIGRLCPWSYSQRNGSAAYRGTAAVVGA